MPYLWRTGRWVTVGLRDELVQVTAVWSCCAQEPARVSERCSVYRYIFSGKDAK